MAQQHKKKKTIFAQSENQYDWVLLILVVILVSLGLLAMFSATSYLGNARKNDGYYYVKEQLVGITLGFAAMIFLMKMNYKRWGRKFWPFLIYMLALTMLILCFVPGFRWSANGAQRWIQLGGRTFQSGEVAKYAVLVLEAALISRQKKGEIRTILGLSVLLLPIAIMGALFYKQPDYSTLLITVLACASMFVLAGMKGMHIAFALVIGIVGGWLLLKTEDYRVSRLTTWQDPFNSPKGNQLIQALYAIASGGFWGQGLGSSKQKFLFLPQQESDFIMSIIVEEMGFIGCFVISILFLLVVWRGYRIASRSKDVFGRMLATGITTLFGLQSLVNIAVAMAAIPTTGVTLPFFSFGSSSMLTSLAVMGVLLSISKYGTEPVAIATTQSTKRFAISN